MKNKQNKIVAVLKDRIISLGNKYLNAVKFVFSIFPTNLDYVFEDEQLAVKPDKNLH